MNEKPSSWSVSVVIDEICDYHVDKRDDGITFERSGTHVQENPPAIGRLDAEFTVERAENADDAIESVRKMLAQGPGQFEIIGATEISTNGS